MKIFKDRKILGYSLMIASVAKVIATFALNFTFYIPATVIVGITFVFGLMLVLSSKRTSTKLKS